MQICVKNCAIDLKKNNLHVFLKNTSKFRGVATGLSHKTYMVGVIRTPKLRYKSNKMWRFRQILVAFSEYMNCNFKKNAPSMAWVRYFRVLFLHLGCVKSIFSRLYGRFTIRNASWTCLFMFLFCTFHIRATGI